jgi:hypothetical protein
VLVSVPFYIQPQPPLSVAAEDKPLWNLVVEHKLHGVILTSGSASKVNTIVPAAIPPEWTGGRQRESMRTVFAGLASLSY